MAGVKISELDELTGANATDSDVLVIVDISDGVDGVTKKIKYGNLIASQIETAEKSDQIRIEDLAAVDFSFPVLVAQSAIAGDRYDSVGFNVDGTDKFLYNPAQGKITVSRLEGVADEALVADSANFNLNSINDVSDAFPGLVSGQVLKYDGTKWTNQNDIVGTSGSGVIAQQIQTKSAGDLDASFLIPMVGSVGADSVDVDNQLTYNPSSNTLTTTNFAGNASSATTADLATVSTDTRNVIADSATTGALYLLMREDFNLGADSAKFDLNFTYNATSETLFASNFSGDGSSVTNVAAASATTADAVAVSSASNDATFYVHFGDATSGTDALNVNTNLTYNPSGDGLLTSVLAYTATTPGDWNGSAPTTVGDAIDRLATLVKTLNGGTGA